MRLQGWQSPSTKHSAALKPHEVQPTSQSNQTDCEPEASELIDVADAQRPSRFPFLRHLLPSPYKRLPTVSAFFDSVTKRSRSSRPRASWPSKSTDVTLQTRIVQSVSESISAVRKSRQRSLSASGTRSRYRISRHKSLSDTHRSSHHQSSLSISSPMWPMPDASSQKRIRELVLDVFGDAHTFEGMTAQHFIAKSEAQIQTLEHGRIFLNSVRDVIGDLTAFIARFRIGCGDSRVNMDSQMIHHVITTAVEEFFCTSLRGPIQQSAQLGTDSSRLQDFRHRCDGSVAISTMPPHPLVSSAITHMEEFGRAVTPTRKMEELLRACQSICDYLTATSPSMAMGTGDNPDVRVAQPMSDADSFFPVLIHVVAHSRLEDPFRDCMIVSEMFSFPSAFGERRYYLTTLEAALHFLTVIND